MTAPTDETIILAVLRGEVQQFRLLVERHSPMAYRAAFAVVRHHEDAQEVVQDAFLKAFNALHGFGGKAAFSTWLFRIVYYTALNRLKKNKARAPHVHLGETPVAMQPAEGWEQLLQTDRVRFVEQALRQLAPEERLALSLYYLEEKTMKEIAVITGWSLPSAKVKVHRARQKLQALLGDNFITEKDDLL